MGERDVLALWAVARIAALAAGVSVGGACIMEDDRCGKYQLRVPDQNLCRCQQDAVLNPDGPGCILCGENEQSDGSGKCECKPGFTRSSPQVACMPSMGSTVGQPCSADAPCSDPNPYCATVLGYSFCTTTGCTKNADCATDWVCGADGELRFCRPPIGLGQTCRTQEDCAGTEATYCETFQLRTCLIQNCRDDPSVCPSGEVCCDLTNLLAASVCITESYLSDGRCIDGKPPVRP